MDQNVRLDAQAGFAALLGFDEEKPGRGVGAALDKSQTLGLAARRVRRPEFPPTAPGALAEKPPAVPQGAARAVHGVGGVQGSWCVGLGPARVRAAGTGCEVRRVAGGKIVLPLLRPGGAELPQVAADRRDVRGVGVFGQGRGAEGGRGGVDLQRGAGAAVPGVVPNE